MSLVAVNCHLAGANFTKYIDFPQKFKYTIVVSLVCLASTPVSDFESKCSFSEIKLGLGEFLRLTILGKIPAS